MFSGPQHFKSKFLYQLALPHAFIYLFKELAEYIQQHQHQCQQHLLHAYYALATMMSAREVRQMMLTVELLLWARHQLSTLHNNPPNLK